jgi:antitoxin component of MazEF toxin-antitoxin module
MAIQRILKWGNSLALRIPSAIAKQMRVCEGKKVEIYRWHHFGGGAGGR